MRNPIENLGDYNTVREALQAVGGKKEILYKTIGDTAISKATPKLLLKGGLIATCIIGGVHFGKKAVSFVKDRKKKIAFEPLLKKEFDKAIDMELSKNANEDNSDCDEVN